MKTALTKFMAFGSIALLLLASCKKSDLTVTTSGGTAGVLSANATTLVLQKTALTDTTKVIKFTFSKPVYEYSAAVVNTLQIDLATDNWSKATTVTLSTNVLSQGYATADFNALLLKLGVPAGVATKVNIRIQHSLGTSIAPVYSNVLSMTVTDFNLKSFLYVAGAYEGWANPGPQEDSLCSVTGNGVYVGIINFTAGNNQFLVLPKKNWDNKYATNDPEGSTSGTIAYNAPHNFYAPATAGQYLVTFNLNNNTISFALADYYSVIGDGAQGWGTDVAMKYLNDGFGNWTTATTTTTTLPLVSTGSIKVRQDNAWSNSWGIPKSGSAGFGVANTLNNSSNDNIPVPVSGNYVMTFNAPATPFGTPVGTAAGSNPIGTTTYTLTKQ